MLHLVDGTGPIIIRCTNSTVLLSYCGPTHCLHEVHVDVLEVGRVITFQILQMKDLVRRVLHIEKWRISFWILPGKDLVVRCVYWYSSRQVQEACRSLKNVVASNTRPQLWQRFKN